MKICGINSAAAMDAAVAAGADWIGFVFFAASPRYVTAAEAADLSGRHPGGPLRVALLVDPGEDEVAAIVGALRPDALQLHGVDQARAAALRAKCAVPVWQAIGIATGADLPRSAADGLDGFLLDAKPPPDARLPGGNAATFDWSLLRGWQAPRPWILAGGLTPENVAGAITATGAVAVDVSSGVESRRGVKDPERIAAFVAAATNWH